MACDMAYLRGPTETSLRHCVLDSQSRALQAILEGAGEPGSSPG